MAAACAGSPASTSEAESNFNPDACEPNPCQNGGTCTDTGGDVTCACTADWTGPLCAVNACDDGNPCTLDDNTASGCVHTPDLDAPACRAATGSVAAGAFHSCAIREGGRVYCWGMREGGRLGDALWAGGYALTPVPVLGLIDAVAVDAGYDHACAVRATGEVVCWGNNALGQLGNGTTLSSTIPTPVSGITDGVAVATARTHTCVLRASGELWCFGRGLEGQLGNGASTNALLPVKVIDDVDLVGPAGTPVPHAPIPWTGVAATELFTCGMRASGQVLCWGANFNGQLGFGATGNRTRPSRVDGLTDAIAITAGRVHACAIRATGNVACWGSSFALGRTGADLLVPALIDGPTGPFANALTIAASGFHTCATTIAGGTWCWGQSSQGELAQTTTSALPVAIPGAKVGASSVATASGFCHACALLEDGDVQCWGSQPAIDVCRDQLGAGVAGGSLTPITTILPGP
jgi:alpha-tubulin suppressor-like RCC1 family protein